MDQNSLKQRWDEYCFAVIALTSLEDDKNQVESRIENYEGALSDGFLDWDSGDPDFNVGKILKNCEEYLDELEDLILMHEEIIDQFEKDTKPKQRAQLLEAPALI